MLQRITSALLEHTGIWRFTPLRSFTSHEIVLGKGVQMPDTVRRIDYYAVLVPNKPGEAARTLTALEEAGINLTGFSGFPEGRKAQMDFIPADPAAFKAAARKVGLNIGAKKTCFILQGEDRPGAVAALTRRLAEAGINITALQAACAGEGRYGVLFWVKPDDVRKAAKAVGAQ